MTYSPKTRLLQWIDGVGWVVVVIVGPIYRLEYRRITMA